MRRRTRAPATRLQMCALSAVLATVGLAVPSEAASTPVLVLHGTGTSSVQVELTSRLTLDVSNSPTLGGPVAGRLTRPALGFVVTDLDRLRVVAGAVRSDYLERHFGATFDLPLGPRRVTLEPGSYRFTLVATGRAQVIIPLVNRTRSLTWRTSTPSAVNVDVGPLLPEPPRASHSTPIGVSTRTYIYAGMVHRRVVSPVFVGSYCFLAEAQPTCLGGEPGPAGASVVSGGTGVAESGSGGAAGRAWQPGSLTPARYVARFEGMADTDGGYTAYALLSLQV